MKKAQGSLEYLIIITAVLSISAVVVFMVTGSVGNSKSNILISNCQAAAEQCHLLKAANPSTVCTSCDTQCADSSSGNEIFPGAIDCCKAGNSSGIYEGSTGCIGGTNNGENSTPGQPQQNCSSDVECNDNNTCTADSCVNGYCSYSSVTNGVVCNSGAGECEDGVCVAYQCTSESDCPDDTDCASYSCDLDSHTCVSQNAADGELCNSNKGQCKTGSCVAPYMCKNNDGLCPSNCTTFDDNDCPTIALAGEDVTRIVPEVNKSIIHNCRVTNNGESFDIITSNLIWYSRDLNPYHSCSDYPYDSEDYSTGYHNGINTGPGVFIERVTGLQANQILQPKVHVDLHSYGGGSTMFYVGASLFESPVMSTNLGDGNWVYCGSILHHGHNDPFSGTRYCPSFNSSDGELYIAILIQVYRTPSLSAGVALVGINTSVDPSQVVQLKGKGAAGDGASYISEYAWDFDSDGVYDWFSTESSKKMKYYKESPLFEILNNLPLTKEFFFYTHGLDPYKKFAGYEYASTDYSSGTYDGNNTGTGVFVRKIKNLPKNTPLNINISIMGIEQGGADGGALDVSAAVYVKNTSVTSPGSYGTKCGSYDKPQTPPDSQFNFTAQASNFITTTGELYVTYTQHVSTDTDRNATIRLQHFNVTYYSPPQRMGWVTHTFQYNPRIATFRVTDNKGQQDTDQIKIDIEKQ